MPEILFTGIRETEGDENADCNTAMAKRKRKCREGERECGENEKSKMDEINDGLLFVLTLIRYIV